MDALDKVALMAELSGEHCALEHGPGIDNEKIPAADYIVMPFGYEENISRAVAKHELVIPVCLDCAMALRGEEWTLLYCFECAESRWLNRRLARNRYRHHILWLRGCPECTDTFGGLYFTDISSLGINVGRFAVNDLRVAV